MATPAEDLPSRLDRGHELLYVQIAFLAVAGISVIVRAYVKMCIVKHQSLDDYLIYLAMAGYAAYAAIAIDGVIHGATGKHYSLKYSDEEASRSLHSWYLCMVLYPPITMTIRASVCVLLLRLSRTKLHRWIVWVNFGVLALVSVAFFFILVFQCSPPAYFWTHMHGAEGFCHNKLIVTYSTTVHSVISAVSDWCLGLLPVVLLWHVRINHRTKAIIAVLLSLGMIAGVALIVRIPYVTRLPPGPAFIYKSLDVALWSVMEPALGIIAACVATFRPLFKNWGFGWTSGANGSSGQMQLSNTRHWNGNTHRQYARQPSVDDGDEEEGSILSRHEMNINKTVSVEVKSEARPSNDEERVTGISDAEISSPP